MPTYYTLFGRTQAGATGLSLSDVATRANDLFYKATGQSLPNVTVLKGNQNLVVVNNKLANNLKIQEQTVSANVDLSLANMNKNGLNSSGFKPLDSLIDNAKNLFQDPNIGQFLSQNQTIQNEVGSLLAVKNASGTTVYDKLSSAGIIGKDDSPAVIQQKVQTLLKEAGNFADALNTRNNQLWQQNDPLKQSADNPNRTARNGTTADTAKVNDLLSKQGIDYNTLISQMSNPPAGQFPAVDATTGQPVYATKAEISSGKYIAL